MGGGSVEVDTLIESRSLNDGVGSGGESVLSILTCSAETAKSADEQLLKSALPKWVSPLTGGGLDLKDTPGEIHQ